MLFRSQYFFYFFFFFNDTATTEIYTLSLHDALPIYQPLFVKEVKEAFAKAFEKLYSASDLQDSTDWLKKEIQLEDRKSTRLNSSHLRESRMPSSA